MQLKTKILKCTNMLRKIYIIAIGTLFIAPLVSAQEKLKIDGVATVVGKNIVLDSEVEAFKNELLQQSDGKANISDCDMLEQIMNVVLAWTLPDLRMMRTGAGFCWRGAG